MAESDEFIILRIELCHHDSSFIRLRSGRREKAFIKFSGSKIHKLFCKLYNRLGWIERRHVSQIIDLGDDFPVYVLIGMPYGDG